MNVMVFTLRAAVLRDFLFFFLMKQDMKLQRMAGVTHRKVTGELLELHVRKAFHTPLSPLTPLSLMRPCERWIQFFNIYKKTLRLNEVRLCCSCRVCWAAHTLDNMPDSEFIHLCLQRSGGDAIRASVNLSSWIFFFFYVRPHKCASAITNNFNNTVFLTCQSSKTA